MGAAINTKKTICGCKELFLGQFSMNTMTLSANMRAIFNRPLRIKGYR